MIQVVFFDIDGTLVSPTSGTVSEPVIQAIATIRKKGVLPVLVSGRPDFAILPVAELLAIDSYIAYNGGRIVANGKILYKNPFDRQVLEQFVTFTLEHNYPLIFPGEDNHFLSHPIHPALTALFSKSKAKMPIYVPDYWKMNDVYQMELIAQHSFLEMCRHQFKEQLSFYPWHVYKGAANVNPINTSKARAIQMLLDHLSIDVSASAAIGDGTNDIEMIRAAGIGIAMGNACEELKAVADVITDDVMHDGVEKALYEIILKL